MCLERHGVQDCKNSISTELNKKMKKNHLLAPKLEILREKTHCERADVVNDPHLEDACACQSVAKLAHFDLPLIWWIEISTAFTDMANAGKICNQSQRVSHTLLCIVLSPYDNKVSATGPRFLD